jgi:hypothetical protein
MQFAAVLDGLPLDLLSSFENALAASEVDVGGGEIVQALMVAPVIVTLDEVCDGLNAGIVDACNFALLIDAKASIVFACLISLCAAALANYLLTSRFVFRRGTIIYGFALFLRQSPVSQSM